MKESSLLIWLTQLGLSVSLPIGGFLLLAVWLYQVRNWGFWVIPTELFLGLVSAVSGFRISLKAMDIMSRDSKKQEPPSAPFDDNK